MLFRTLVAPFARALAPRGWVVPLILGVGAAAQFFNRRRQQGQYRQEVDQAREARGDLFAAVGPRLAGLEGVDPNILRAAGMGLPPAPPRHSNLFETALQIAGAYSKQQDIEDEAPPAEGEPGGLPTTPPGQDEAAQMGGLTQPQGDPAAQAADQAVQAGGGEPAQMGGLTEQQPAAPEPGTEDAAAQQTAASRNFINPLDVMMMA